MNTPRKHFDEMLLGANDVRAPYSAYDKWFAAQDPARLTKKSKEAEAFFFAEQASLLTSTVRPRPKND